MKIGGCCPEWFQINVDGLKKKNKIGGRKSLELVGRVELLFLAERVDVNENEGKEVKRMKKGEGEGDSSYTLSRVVKEWRFE